MTRTAGQNLVDTIRVIGVGAALLWSVGLHLEASAQTDQTETRYTFVLSGIPLADALEEVVDRTNLSLVYESSLTAGRTSFCRVREATSDELLRCILRGTGVDFARLSSGTYVLALDRMETLKFGTISGRVIDASTGLALADAAVTVVDSNIGTYTSSRGRFTLPSLPPGPYRIRISHVAFAGRADSLVVASSQLRQIEVALTPNVVFTEPVVVTGFTQRDRRQEPGTIAASGLANLSGPGQSGDGMVPTLSSVTGVRIGDALADVHLQGGAVDEQQLLLDGVPVFAPVANGGFIGPFSAFATGRITIRKAGYGASNGNGLSGVVEVEQTLGEPGATVQLDPLSSNLRWSSRFGRPERTQVTTMVASRIGLWELFRPARLERMFSEWAAPDPFLRDVLATESHPPQPQQAEDVLPIEFNVTDLHLASEIKFSPLQTLRLSGYRGASRFNPEDRLLVSTGSSSEYELDNKTASATYEWVQSSRLFANAMAWRSSYHVTHPTPLSVRQPIDDFNEMIELGLRLGGDYVASQRHQLRLAIDVTHYNSDFALSTDPSGSASVGPSVIEPLKVRTTGFIEDNVSISESTALTAGLRATYVPTRDEFFAEPRLALQIDGSTARGVTWSTRLGAGIYRQFLTSIDLATENESALLPQVRVWVPIGAAQFVPKAYHLTASTIVRPSKALEVGIEVYYKEQRNLSVLDYSVRSAPDDTLARSPFTTATGNGHGFSAFVRRSTTRASSTVQYEYARAKRTVVGRFDSRQTTVPWENPHSIIAGSDVSVTSAITATVRWQLLIGRSWGFRQTYYDYLEPRRAEIGSIGYDLSDPEGHVLPAFSQLDVGMAYTHAFDRASMQVRLLLLNVTDRKNVVDWSLRYDEASGTYEKVDRTAVPFFPSLSVRLSI